MNTTSLRGAMHTLTALVFVTLAGSHSAFAAARTWTGNGSTSNFTNGGNWNGSTDIVSGDSLTFGALGTGGWLTLVNNLTDDWTVAGMTFNSSAVAYTIKPTDGEIHDILLTGNIANNNTQTQTINLVMALDGNRTVSTYAGSEIILGGRLMDVSGAATGSLIKAGAGTLTLNYAGNSYDGDTTVNEGTLRLGSTGSIPYGASNGNLIVNAAGTFNLNATSVQINGLSGNGTVTNSEATAASLLVGDGDRTTTFGGAITGNLSLTKIGNGTLTLDGDNTYTGDTTVTAGTLKLGPNNAIPNGAGTGNVIVIGTLDVNGYGENINGLSGNGTVDNTSASAATLNVGYNDQDSTFSGFIQNSNAALSLTKTGNGTLTLAGYNSFTGGFTLNAGTVLVGHVNALGANVNVATINGGTLASSDDTDYRQLAQATNVGGDFTMGQSSGGTRALDLRGAMNLGGATRTITIATTYGYISGVISNGGLTKAGNGTLTLSGNNTFTGDTKVAAGTLTLMSENALAGSTLDTDGLGSVAFGQLINTLGGLKGTRDLVISTGRLLNIGANDQSTDYSGALSGGGGLTKVGNGTLTLSGNNAYSGNTTVGSGTLKLGADEVLPNGTGKGNVEVVVGHTLDLNARSETINGLSGGGTVDNKIAGAATLTVGDNNQTSTFSGVIQNTQGTLSLAKIGTGALTLSGNNTFTGGVALNEGTILVGNAQALGANGTVATINGGTLASSTATGYTLAQATTLGGNFTMGQSSGGTGAIDLHGAMNFGGATRTITIANTYDFISGVISNGGFTKAGTGRLYLSGNNTFTGGFTLNAGTIMVDNNHALGATENAVTINGGTLSSSGNGTSFSLAQSVTVGGDFELGYVSGGTGVLTFAGAMNLGAATRTITVKNNADIISGVISNGGLTKAGNGTLTLSGNNTFTGDTLVSAGQLALESENALAGSTLDTTGVGTVTYFAGTNNIGGLKGSGPIDNGGNLLSIGANNQNTTYSGVLSGNGGLTKTGSGAQTLSGNNTYKGATTVNSGTFLINGSTAADSTITVDYGATLGGSGTISGNTTISGTHSPGNSPGLQTFASNLTYADGSTVVWELNSNTIEGRGTNFDGINVNGALTINDTTTLNLVFNGAGSTVDWTNDLWATEQDWLFFDVAGMTQGTLTMGVVSLDANGIVLAAVRPDASFTITKNGNDILVSYAVPEPGTWALLGASLTAVVIFRRRRHI